MSTIAKKMIFWFAILLVATTSGFGQITAPDFNCVQNDTLIWEMPSPACGPVEGYEIYFSEQENGPFSLLTTINNPDSLEYFHDHLSGKTFYYYILTLADCPGQSATPSDTLDNRPPSPATIESVSVENGSVEVDWSPSDAPETIGYIIYRATGLGTVPIDTVFSGLTYTDTEARAETGEQFYYVISLDECGNTSLFDTTHHTIFAEAAIDSCLQTARLNWSLYENWSQGIQNHIVFLSTDGSPELPVDTLPPGDTTYALSNLKDSTEYCVTIRASENQTGEISRSNQLCFIPDIAEPMDYIDLLNASVTGSGEVSLNWRWDADAELADISLLRSTGNTTDSLAGIVPLQPLNASETYIDNGFSEYTSSHTYQLTTGDMCDSTTSSNPIQTIFLDGENGAGATNELEWTAFSSPLSTVQSYEIFALFGGMNTQIATLPADSLTYIHQLDINEAQNASVCYYVEAVHRIQSSGETYRSRSNTICLDQDVSVFVPNAFVPEGSNRFFKPVFVFPQNITSYSMIIFDRFGGKIFSTNDIDQGWYGTEADGNRLPKGVYVYLLQWETTNGVQHEKRGNVLLIR